MAIALPPQIYDVTSPYVRANADYEVRPYIELAADYLPQRRSRSNSQNHRLSARLLRLMIVM